MGGKTSIDVQPTRLGPRPEWISRLNSEGEILDSRHVVPLDAASLIAAACDCTGLSDFGDGPWREHLEMLLRSLEEEANLHLLGRLYTRSDLLIYLQGRLQSHRLVQAAILEIEDEVITEPVFVIGLGRSGTTILQETLAQDDQFRFRPQMGGPVSLPTAGGRVVSVRPQDPASARPDYAAGPDCS